ncbi:DNA-directed RNA polymerase III subunit RPC7 isoform X3 [Erpetoichthys calabaricus]|uniref:DNA-directed RNA polymerase III subunit RPC7 isoform X3 n=1 Tax=Erpetoichthys calabaricus TaxID=27687 RepID=UPI0022346700|nr:DNA-directed RNA polymerase III subunit RPC7 isoform X3 [Erpetoichthys calabaricus]
MCLFLAALLLRGGEERSAMAGRGRGRAAFTFNIEALGLAKGESLPESAFQPKPLYPIVDSKPVPLKTGEGEDYMLALKQEIRGSMKALPYYILLPGHKTDVERYKERYTQEILKKLDDSWIPDWRRLPKELRPIMKKKKKSSKIKAKPSASLNKEDVLSKLEALEKQDGDKSDEEGEKKKKEKEEEEDEDAEPEEEEYDEEAEEENDYISSYFDNGEDFEAGSDDNMDEATY